MKELKQVIVVRKDLKMSPGKLAAQVAHASINAVLNEFNINLVNEMLEISLHNQIYTWSQGSHTKIIVAVESEEDLLNLYSQVQGTDVPKAIIKDEARTELSHPTYTALAIGPAHPYVIDVYTGKLPLL